MAAVEFHLKVLGLSGSPGRTEITRAYRREMNRWHPDRHLHDSQRQIAEEAAKLINAAYAFLKAYPFEKRRDAGFASSEARAPKHAATGKRTASAAHPTGPRASAPADTIVPVNTTLIIAVRYDGHTKSFAVFFRNGHISRFIEVPRTLFEQFLGARDKDRFFNETIGHVFVEESIA